MKKLLLLLAVLAIALPLSACKPKGGDSGGLDENALRRAFLNEYVYFDFDRYNIRSDQVSVLQAKAAYLQQVNSSVTLYGYCDERGTEAYNLALGDRRAKSAANYLVDLGISGSRLAPISGGESNPRALGHDEASWAQNRRVEFTLN
jgi:peptidoglycan-associated lipoprotein